MPADSVPAVILAAGVGRRLEPLTTRRPKPMLPVANRPILEYVLDAVAATDIDRVVLVVGYRAERIRTHVGDGDDWGLEVEYVEQPTQLGTGHAVLQATAAVDGPFLVLNGDRILEPSIVDRVLERVRAGRTPVLATTTVAQPREYGVVTLEGDRVTGIEEKPLAPVETNRINAGVYGFSSAIFEALSETTPAGELELTATLDDLASERELTAVRYDGRWLDVSQLWDLLSVTAALLDGGDVVDSDSQGTDSRRVDAKDDRAFDDTGTGDPPSAAGATIAEDALVDPTAHIGPHATIGGGTAIGPNVVVGANAVVERAVVFPDVVIGAGAVVREAVIATNARLGPNVTITGGPSVIVVDDAVHRDVDLGGVVGDNATIGGGATLTDGAVVGDDARVDAGLTLDGRIESGAVVRRP